MGAFKRQDLMDRHYRQQWEEAERMDQEYLESLYLNRSVKSARHIVAMDGFSAAKPVNVARAIEVALDLDALGARNRDPSDDQQHETKHEQRHLKPNDNGTRKH